VTQRRRGQWPLCVDSLSKLPSINAKQQPSATVELRKVAVLSIREDGADIIALIGLVLGGPLISVLYSAYGEETQAAVMVPIALYQGVQLLDFDNFLSLLT
jgi:hypothetical protein